LPTPDDESKGMISLKCTENEIQLYILKISIIYYFMLIVLKMNILIFLKKGGPCGKYGFFLMHK
jgi:hypothetical protein